MPQQQLALNLNTAASTITPFTFIDLFAGIGGFHLALEQEGGHCVFASEKDPFARKTYLANHTIDETYFNDDIRSISPEAVPDHDVLCAGFPCQPFSQAGRKKGFSDGDESERGNLFFCILDILEAKRPKAFILENVRHLENHDGGNTLKTILAHLEQLEYQVSYKVLKASEFGMPQLRPRIFIVGFDRRQVDTTVRFSFPTPIPLQFTMSDVWGGDCSREIGFTLRVGGKGSDITDRRNWDAYLVDGQVRRLGVVQAKKMMGLPEAFIFPVAKTQAMKQLGNSVCVPVVQHVARQVNQYIHNHVKDSINMMQKLNRGEWSELFALLSLLIKPKLPFGTAVGTSSDEYVLVFKLHYNAQDVTYCLSETQVTLLFPDGTSQELGCITEVISPLQLAELKEFIIHSKGTFSLDAFQQWMQLLQINHFKGTSQQKQDFTLAFQHNGLCYEAEPLGIKSYLGNLPTLLNSSTATNFLFEVKGFTGTLDDVNIITTRNKIRDRIQYIETNSGQLVFVGCENSIHEENLRKVDSCMPELLADVLLQYYKGLGARFSALSLSEQQRCRLKDYLKAVLLGMFSSTRWDGNYTANGTVVVKKDGDMVLYHVIKDAILKEYLMAHAKLDTPSSTRHRFGQLYKEADGRYFIKLNLQIRLTD
jgi:DNA (cytosine-5)-methyltransferase 1